MSKKFKLYFFLIIFITMSARLDAGELHQHSTFDPSIANPDRLIDTLKKTGQIKSKSRYEQEIELRKILKARFEASQKLDDIEIHNKRADLKRFRQIRQKMKKANLKSFSGKHLSPLTPSELQAPKKDKILAILVEFPDLDHTQVTPEMTKRYFENYNPEHYHEMLFSSSGYEGPKGQNLISLNQYLLSQSGNSYSVEGQVMGWYKVAKPAKHYGGNDKATRNDAKVKELVKEALLQLAQDPLIDLSEFDQEDRYDSDDDGNYREPDGIIDHIMVFHASIGEENGGGALGSDAIWSHRSTLGKFKLGDSPYYAGDYTIQPIDAAAGVTAHEYAHDLGLPDEYDVGYTGLGSPVGFWSIMSGGSWAGKIPGTEPTGFSPYAREFLQASLGGNWLVGQTINYDELGYWGENVTLDQASIKGENLDVVRINLPDLVIAKTPEPVSGETLYNAHTIGLSSMLLSYNLASRSTNDRIVLSMDAHYEMAESSDFFVLYSGGGGVVGNRTVVDPENPYRYQNTVSGSSEGWVKLEYDLSAFAGKLFSARLNYVNTSGERLSGLSIDNIRLEINGRLYAYDTVENKGGWHRIKPGDFVERTGNEALTSEHYYLLEWRNHEGVDKSLAYLSNGWIVANPGLTIWYVNPRWGRDNRTGKHPGRGFLSLIDADPKPLMYLQRDIEMPWNSAFQLYDATFGLSKPAPLNTGNNFADNYDKRPAPVPYFYDQFNYENIGAPEAGTIVPDYGLIISVLRQPKDKSYGEIQIRRTRF